jgi:hypothetical protein
VALAVTNFHTGIAPLYSGREFSTPLGPLEPSALLDLLLCVLLPLVGRILHAPAFELFERS